MTQPHALTREQVERLLVQVTQYRRHSVGFKAAVSQLADNDAAMRQSMTLTASQVQQAASDAISQALAQQAQEVAEVKAERARWYGEAQGRQIRFNEMEQKFAVALAEWNAKCQNLEQEVERLKVDVVKRDCVLTLLHFIVEHDGDFDNPETVEAEAIGNGLENVLMLKQQLAASQARVRELENATPSMYPIMRGPSVPWEVMRPHESWAQKNHSQSLQQLANRGGLSPGEAWCVVNGIHYGIASKEQWTLWDAEWFKYAERVNLHYDQLATLQATLAERERRIAELEGLP
jgi:hypothetical protein